ncbi:hypothetical protein QN277_026493 [Acacia crassicarpa]|uniref:CCHC-type domain-containing protein n=1 Tax=Acacia crassicarpa TaxID=499986 RepID=A0AAE1JBF9_9FABA|nr:hypothetical protein QN277_026493 [Acacia crassicarpa]
MASEGKTVSLVPLSREEDDLLMRSSKKIRNDGINSGDTYSLEMWPKLGEKGAGSSKGGASYAEKLKGQDQSSDNEQRGGNKKGPEDDMSEDDQDVEDDEPACVTEEDLTRNFPTFTFSEKLKKPLYRAWQTSVIVKLLDKSIGYKALLARLQFLWAKRGVVNLIDIGYGFFVVKFTNKDDYENALTGGPWIIYDYYLTVRPWEPNFIPIRAEIDKVAVWVRIPNVVLECYDHEALRIIGDRIGQTLKVDMNTSSHLRGRYARICVLVDLRKQLMSGFRLDGEDYFLEYEGLHLLCNNCGLYGHVRVSCPSRKKNAGRRRW